MKSKEIKEMNISEIRKLIEEKKSKALKLRFDISSKQIKNHREYRNIRKDIAKALTIIKEKESENKK